MTIEDPSTQAAMDKIGEYLLKGWVLTDETCTKSCRGMPLLRTKDRSEYVCPAGCLDPKGKNPAKSVRSEEEFVIVSEQQRLSPVKESSVNATAKKSARDEGIAKVGQMLLSGWTMLDEPCLTCIEFPLMQSRLGEKVCAHCQNAAPVRKEAADDVPEKKPVPMESAPVSNLTKKEETSVKADPTSRDEDELTLLRLQSIQTLKTKVQDLNAQLCHTNDPSSIASVSIALERSWSALHAIHQ